MGRKAKFAVGLAAYLGLFCWSIAVLLSPEDDPVPSEIAPVQLNDSTQAKLAASKLEKDSLEVLLKAAKQLNGKLIAAMRIKVPAKETVIVHDTTETLVYADGTRTSVFKDSLEWVKLSGTVTAPPYPAPLKVTYDITRPAFNPAVGLIQSGDAVYAVVSWQNEKASIQVPYQRIPPKVPRSNSYARAAWSPLGEVLVGGGMEFRIGRFSPFAEIQGIASQKELRPGVWLGTTYRF